MIKKALAVLFAFMLLFMSACTPVKDSLKIYAPKIGKADCFIFTGNGECVMIDTGEAEDYAEISGKLNDFDVKKIDFLIITHFDTDHVGSASFLIDNYQVGTILRTSHPTDTAEYNDFLLSCNEKNIKPVTVMDTYSFTACGAEFSVYPPKYDSYKKNADNNSSLATVIKKDGHTLFFAGDAEKERLSEIMDICGCDLLKYPHHGSNNKLTESFIAAASPEYTLITCSDKNPPDPETLAQLASAGSKVFETRNGDIEITVSNKGISVKQY